ncbi:MAG: 30S ribosomal protein S13 [Euryarchaeota archaeon]|nr:30S ribosomal protein S13 [Euryarchaeota archaeon]
MAEPEKTQKPEKSDKPEKHEKKDKGEKGKAPEKSAAPKPVKKMDADFKYIVRLAGADLDGNKPAIVALTGIKGVGNRIADVIIRDINFPRHEKIGKITDAQIEQAEKVLGGLSETLPEWMVNRQDDFETGDSFHILGPQVEITRRDDINRMKMIRCYKGIRHEQGQKVRGQRTRSNGRTGLTLGVIRTQLKKPAEGEGGEKT